MTSMFSRQYDDADRIPGQPIPIKPMVPEPGAYPLEALCPKLQAAARAIVDKVQLPASIAANSVLAAAALAVQGFIDIRLPTGEIIPSSLFMISVAASGDRKSSADKLALRAIRERECEMHDEHASRQATHAADLAAYKASRKQAENTKGDRHAVRDAIEQCGREPLAPPVPVLISDEGTLQGLQKAFAEGMPSLGLFSDEGGQWLGGYAMSEENRGQTGAALSKLWDGSPIKRVRGSDAITILRGRRLSTHLMIQHRIAKRLFGDPDLKDQGLLSRLLVCQPLTMKGERVWRDPDVSSDHDLELFHVRLYRLLTDPLPMDVDTRALSPRVVTLSADARELFIRWHDAVEMELRPDGAFDDIAGFAAKLPEHSVRIAAVMAYFEDRNLSEISASALSAGIKIAKFHVAEALRVIGVSNGDVDTENAAALIEWIRKKEHRVVAARWLSRNVIPKSLRPAAVLKRAIELLVEMKHLVPIKGGGSMTVNGVTTFYQDAFTVIADDPE